MMDLIVGLSGAAAMTLLNAAGARIAVGFQKFVTFSFLTASALLILLGFAQGDPAHWQPLFQSAQGRSFGGGMFVMLGVAGMWLAGFQTAASAVEERAPGTSFTTVARAMMGAVAVAAIFYSLIILASASLIPWHDLNSGALPVAAAFDHALPGGVATKGILLVAMASCSRHGMRCTCRPPASSWPKRAQAFSPPASRWSIPAPARLAAPRCW